MKNLSILLMPILCLLGAGCAGSVAAQTVPEEPGSDEVSTSGSETETSEVEELAPLDEVEVPEPVLSTGENGERQTYLSAGEPAPWAGVLLNPEAMAFVISQYEAAFERAGAALRLQRELDSARLHLEVGRLRLQIDTERAEHRIIVGGLEREVARLIQIHEDYVAEQTGGFWNSDVGRVIEYGLIIIGAAAVGLVIGLGVGAAGF